jgi:hypothetical protein
MSEISEVMTKIAGALPCAEIIIVVSAAIY